MNVEERARFKALLDGFEHNALRDNEIKELIELARKAERAIDHLPLFCTFCGGMPDSGGRILRPQCTATSVIRSLATDVAIRNASAPGELPLRVLLHEGRRGRMGRRMDERDMKLDIAARLDNLLADVPLDEDEQRDVVAETGIDAQRLAERLRARVEEEALRGIAGNGLIPGKPWPTKT